MYVQYCIGDCIAWPKSEHRTDCIMRVPRRVDLRGKQSLAFLCYAQWFFLTFILIHTYKNVYFVHIKAMMIAALSLLCMWMIKVRPLSSKSKPWALRKERNRLKSSEIVWNRLKSIWNRLKSIWNHVKLSNNWLECLEM